jgi:hypothetical protein
MASNCVDRLNKVLDTLNEQKVTNYAYRTFVKNTPIRSGNARRKTRLQGNTIDAAYPYAQRLEEGYSKQAPKGMTEPTIDEVRKYVYNKLGVKI